MKELKRICNKIIKESSTKSRSKHPLYEDNINTIISTHDMIFENMKNKPISQKISRLYDELKRPSNSGGVTCRICNIYNRDDIRQHIKNSHNVSTSDYKVRYDSSAVLSDKVLTKYSDRMLGNKNPAFQHGGRLSPFSSKFVKYIDGSADYSPEDAIKKKMRSVKDNPQNQRTKIEFYLAQGLSEDEAKAALSERQSTFSLKSCIEKYGEEEGEFRWQQRQDLWQESLKAKSPEEIDIINQKKGTGRMCQLFNRNPEMKNIPGILYLIKFYNEDIVFWKVGITSCTIKERFGSMNRYNLDMDIITENKNMSFYDCFKAEQSILKLHKDIRINVDYNGFKTTEAFDEPITI